MFPIEQAKEIIDQIIETCETDGKRFYDYYFPPNKKSINRYPPSYVSKEVDQGSIGNCYMIAAISSFALRPELVREAIYPNEWNSAGIFGVKIWIATIREWRMVIIDDYLPYIEDSDLLIFANNKTSNEAWSSLLEKAFAKMNVFNRANPFFDLCVHLYPKRGRHFYGFHF